MPSLVLQGLTRAAIFLTILAMTSSVSAPLQGHVPVTYARLLLEYLQATGHAAERVLGPDLPRLDGSDWQRLAVPQWARMLERAANMLGDPQLGLRLGERITPAHLGVVGYVLLACPDLGAALQKMATYERLIYDVNPLIQKPGPGHLSLRWGVARGRPGPLVDETALAALLQFSRDICGNPELAPLRVDFVNPEPADRAPYTNYFACPVNFAAPLTRVDLAWRDLQHPLRAPDQALLNLLQQQADALLAQCSGDDDLERQLRQVIAGQARAGRLSLASVAAALNLSTRSLHRRLAERGSNFSRLRDDCLRQLAEQYLADPRLQLADVAQLLGYSEQSAFNRAFRRWSGRTPRQARRSLVSSG